MSSRSVSPQRKWWRGLSCLLSLLILCNLAPAASANDDGVNKPQVPTWADDGALEVGVWYVVDYPPAGAGGADLPATAPDALGLRDRLTQQYYPFFPFEFFPTPRWSAPYAYGNTSAWESDWTTNEEIYIDNVDLAYFSGHGSPTGFYFGVGGNTRNNDVAAAEDVQYRWGTKDNDWIGIAACNVLDDPYANLQRWARAMNGTRLLMGMKTVMSDVDFGTALGWHMRWGNSMAQAWFKATNEKLPTWQIARIVGEETYNYNDQWHHHDDFQPVDDDFFWWTHQAGTAVALAVNVNQLMAAGAAGASTPLAEMPIFTIQPLSLSEAQAQWKGLGAAFGLTNTTIITQPATVLASGVDALQATDNLFVSTNGDLIQNSNTGQYQYHNHKTLWSESVISDVMSIQAAGTAGRLMIDADTARGIADQFLSQNQLMPGDVRFAAVTQDVLTSAQDTGRAPGGANAAGSLRILAETVTNHVVSYQRVISYTPPVQGAAVAAPVQFSVVGPGSSVTVYVAASVAPSGRSLQAIPLNQLVLGGTNGNRPLLQATAAGTNQPLTTPVRPFATIKTLFEKAEAQVALDYIPVLGTKTIVSNTLGYYEGSITWNQDQLIPVNILIVKATPPGGVEQTYQVYIPVNETYMAPYAKITSLTNGATVVPGSKITLEAADASKTLKELGVDASLDFVLGSGGTYVYNWYLNEISDATKIGSGRTVQYTVPDSATTDGKPAAAKVILVVTDVDSPRSPGFASDEVVLNLSKAFLPLVTK
ncbi:MAG: hypothetical protein DYG89_05000 [Caldilinea sp. CFX5]|nr:hypothetical protein [Caldilinea sp. CFX5]